MPHLCSKCVMCESMGDAEFWARVYEAEKVLKRKINEMRDGGAPLDEVVVFLENKVWEMNEAEVSNLDPEFVAIQINRNFYLDSLAYCYLYDHGWHPKHSGEWVRKVDLAKKKADAPKDENARLSADNEELGRKVTQADKTAQEAFDELETKLKNASDELTEALDREKEKDKKIEEYESELQAYADLPAWKRLFVKPPKRKNKE